jgi:predicted amino acid-binding ACT domain protein
MKATSNFSRVLRLLNSMPIALATDARGSRHVPAPSVSVGQFDEVAAVLSTFGRDRVGHLAAHNRTLYENGADIRRQSAHVLNGAFTLVSVVTLPFERASVLRRACQDSLASFAPEFSLVRDGMTLSVVLLDVPGAFHEVAQAIADAGANIRFWSTSQMPAPTTATAYAHVESLIQLPSSGAEAKLRSTLDDILPPYDGAADLFRGVQLD